jgi:OmpA-OmpF porin, OOP family
MRRATVCLALCAAVLASPATADVAGSADHPLIPRYEGSDIVRFESEAFTDFPLLTASVASSGGLERNREAATVLEGRLTRITYRGPADRSTLEVMRNYEQALAAAGFTTIFACGRDECGGRNFNHAASPRGYYMGFGEYHADQRYLAARLARPEGDVYAGLYVVLNQAGGGPDRGRPMIQLDVIELEPMEERMVVVEASQMERDLAADGRVAVYGILFDFDSDRMREDSRPQLGEIARLLTDNPSLEVLIVGHTDAQGSYEYNLDLSLRRARSVVAVLSGEFGIASARLTPVGVGMAAPVATNRTEDGRARNRRVELVER